MAEAIGGILATVCLDVCAGICLDIVSIRKILLTYNVLTSTLH